MSVTAGGIFAIPEESEESLPKSESPTQRKVEPENEEKQVPNDIVEHLYSAPLEARCPERFSYVIKYICGLRLRVDCCHLFPRLIKETLITPMQHLEPVLP